MAGLLNDAFGSPVTYWTEASEERSLQGVFRKEPVQVFGPDGGSKTITQATLKVPLTLAQSLERRILVEDPNNEGELYRIVNRNKATASPGADRFVMFELEREARDYK
jgi:hypothetical protein